MYGRFAGDRKVGFLRTVTRKKQRGREARGKKDHPKQSYKDLSYEKKMKEGLKKKKLSSTRKKTCQIHPKHALLVLRADRQNTEC